MNDATTKTDLAIEHVTRCAEDFRKAMAARDAIEDCASMAWKLAHATARTAAVAKDNAYIHAYETGALKKPYWA